MKKMIFFILAFFYIGFIDVQASKSEIVIDADSGRVLYGKNIHEKSLIASTTKILTALVVLNNASLSDKVNIGDEVLDAYGSAIYIKPGETYTVQDLLYGLLLRSGNDAALSLAVHTAGSLEGFTLLMNETAASIGMSDSIFNNPHGLDEQTENKSSVYDMALLMREAMKNSDFRSITSAKKYTFKSNGRYYEWYNKNKLLSEYKYATGGKIGYTKRARHTFVSSASKDGKNLITVSFDDPNQFVTHKNLYEKYFKEYQKYQIVDQNNLAIPYKKGYYLYTSESFDMLLKDKEVDKLKKEVVLFKKPIKENKRYHLGNIYISFDEKVYKALKIYSNIPKSKEKIIDKIKRKLKW